MVSFTATSVALVAAASMVQPILAHGGFNFAPSLTLFKARDMATRDDSTLEFAACQQAASTITPKPTYIVYANRTVDVNGLPAICISQMNHHNAQSNVAETNKWEGWGIVLNSTAIQTSGVGNALTAYLETIAVNVS